MKVLKIVKHLRARDDVFYKIITDEEEDYYILGSDDLDDEVNFLCSQRFGGERYGFSYDYDFETYPKVIEKVINDEIEDYKLKKQWIESYLGKLNEYLNEKVR